MVIIQLAQSSSTAAFSAIGQGLAGLGIAKQQREDDARKDELVQASQERLRVAQARSEGQRAEQQRVNDERRAGLELDNLRLAGIATPQDIQRKRDLSMVRSLSIPGMGAMGGMKSGELIDAANKAKERMGALEQIFPELSPKDRKTLFAEFDKAEQQNDQMKGVGKFLTTMRDVYRMNGVVDDEAQKAQLDPHIDAAEEYLKDPSEEGYMKAQQSQEFFDNFMEEQANDRNWELQNERRLVELDSMKVDGDSDLNSMIDNLSARMLWDKDLDFEEKMGEVFAAKHPRRFRAGQRANARSDAAGEMKETRKLVVTKLRSERIYNAEGYDMGPRWVRRGEPLTVDGQEYVHGEGWKRAVEEEMQIQIPDLLNQQTEEIGRDAERESRRDPNAAPANPNPTPDPSTSGASGADKWEDLEPAKQQQFADAIISGRSPSELGIKPGDVPEDVLRGWIEQRNAKGAEANPEKKPKRVGAGGRRGARARGEE